MRLLTLLIILLVFAGPSASFAEVLWQTNFNNTPSWSRSYLKNSGAMDCSIENLSSTTCTTYGPPPEGFYAWYMSPAFVDPPTGNGVKIDSMNDRQGNGKAATYYDEYYGTWSNGANLNFRLPDPVGYNEIYVRYWLKFQPGYQYPVGTNVYQKISHISHYVDNGSPTAYFDSGGNFPTEYQQLERLGSGVNDIFHTTTFRGTTPATYNMTLPGLATTSTISYDGVTTGPGIKTFFDIDGDALPVGNTSGTGTDYSQSTADGNWHCYEYYLKNNSAPGATDGVYRFYWDGVLRAESTNVQYRETGSPLGDKVWNMVAIGGNTNFGLQAGQPQIEQWRAYDDITVYTPLTPSDPLWSSSPQDGRLALSYVPSGVDTTPPVTTATPAGGSFTGTQSVTLAANEAATIYYTTDGSTPTTSSAVYSVPILIDKTTTLRYFARDTAGNSETVKTSAYTIVAPPPTTNATINVSGRFSVKR